MDTAAATHPRPWVEHYPEGIAWDVSLNLTPVHEQVIAACARNPSAVALDFLGGTTTFGDLAKSITAFAGALQTQLGARSSTATHSIRSTNSATSLRTPAPIFW